MLFDGRLRTQGGALRLRVHDAPCRQIVGQRLQLAAQIVQEARAAFAEQHGEHAEPKDERDADEAEGEPRHVLGASSGQTKIPNREPARLSRAEFASLAPMNRRQMIQVAASTAVAHGVVTVLGCQAAPKTASAAGEQRHEPKTTPPSPVTPEGARLAAAASDCVRVGETCLEHCLRSLSAGSDMMALCARLVEEMLPICRATATLGAIGSKRLKAMAQLCADACGECAAECEKHAGHHAECKACFEACKATEVLARALV